MYWNYLERHPHFPLPLTVEQEARDALAWFYLGDPLLSPIGQTSGFDAASDNLKEGSRSTVPFSKQECEDLLRAISRISCEISHRQFTTP
jgi:hypothetical protein